MIRLKPGNLIALSTRMDPPGVRYERVDLGETDLASGAHVERWETKKTVADPAEYERATTTRSKIRSLIRGACIYYPNFGVFICPDDQMEDLDKAVAESEALVDSQEWVTCKPRFWVLRGKLAESSREAVQAIRAEIGGLLEQLQRAAKVGDVKQLRDLATQARQLKGTLAPDTDGPVNAIDQAIAAARSLAREIVSKVEKGGERLAAVLTEQKLQPIAAARTAFMLDEPEPAPQTEELVAGDTFAVLEDDDEPVDPAVLKALRAEAQGRLGIPVEVEPEVDEELITAAPSGLFGPVTDTPTPEALAFAEQLITQHATKGGAA